MATYEDILKANQSIGTTDIKGKDYAQVNQRVKAFRMVYPEGSIITEIISLEAGVVTMKARIYADGDNQIATGYAQEKESASYINKTSFIENCETSAVGRALGFAGFGIDTSICSAEELNNAINSQEAIEKREAEERAKATNTRARNGARHAAAKAKAAAATSATKSEHRMKHEQIILDLADELGININLQLKSWGKPDLNEISDSDLLKTLDWLEAKKNA